MRTYVYAKMVVNGKDTSKLDIYQIYNDFHVYEHDENIFTGGWLSTVKFIEDWKEKQSDLVEKLKSFGMEVHFEQNIG